MKWIQSKDCFNEYRIVCDDESISLPIQKSHSGIANSACGSFSQIEREIAAFYRWRGELTLRLIGGKPLRLNGKTTTWKLNRNRIRFTVCDQITTLFEIDLAASSGFIDIADDPTPFAEAEDFDFLLFVHNVMSSPARRKTIYEES